MPPQPSLLKTGAFADYGRRAPPRRAYVTITTAHGENEGYDDLATPPTTFHADACTDSDLTQAAQDIWERTLTLGKQHGFRNAYVSSLPVNISLGRISDSDTFGLEPEQALVKYKKVPGGHLSKSSIGIPIALHTLGYKYAEIDEIVSYLWGMVLCQCPGD